MDKVMDFQAHLAGVAAETEAMLDALIPLPEHGAPGERRLAEIMRYATLGGGKRLRAYLAVQGAQLLDQPQNAGLRVGAAVECLHAYSLVHDDLPAMDDDDLRRGKPTAHKAYDDAGAILAGDALQTLAFEILSDPTTHANATVRADLVLALARASGAHGMVGGQCIDIAAETAAVPLDLDAITRLQALKTGALIGFAAESGAILAQDTAARARLVAYARHLGLAFQIRDDLLDIDGDEAAAGKRLQKDEAAGKATFVSILGVEGARQAAQDEIAAALAALDGFGARAVRLREAAQFVLQRTS